MNSDIPVITIDGPSGVGKGTLCCLLAQHLNWYYLDSGALYRITAYAASQQGIDLECEQSLCSMLDKIEVHFSPTGEALLNRKNISEEIRLEQCGMMASKIAAYPSLREKLLITQRNFLQSPGLVADGRDMGTTVFPSSKHKIFLQASAEVRAKRRYKQLIDKESYASIPPLSKPLDLNIIIDEIKQRDERDMNRLVSPLKPAADAVVIDTSELSIEAVFEKVLALYRNK